MKREREGERERDREREGQRQHARSIKYKTQHAVVRVDGSASPTQKARNVQTEKPEKKTAGDIDVFSIRRFAHIETHSLSLSK